MAVASKSAVSARKSQPYSAKAKVTQSNSGVMRSQIPRSQQSSGTVPFVPISRSAPSWLLRLCCLQHRSFTLMWLLVATMLAAYSWTVYSQQRWNQAYRKLETLQLHERQLVTTNEVLKNQMAQQAQQPDAGLIPPDPATAIVLQAAPKRPYRPGTSVLPIAKNSTQADKLTSTPTPLGY